MPLTALHPDTIYWIGRYLEYKDLVHLGECSRLLQTVANTKSLWREIARRLLYPLVLDQAANSKEEVKVFCRLAEIEKREFAFAARVLPGSFLRPSTFAQMPSSHFFRPSGLHAAWVSPSTVARGGMWDDAAHIYRPILAFSVMNHHVRYSQIIIVTEGPEVYSVDTREYLARLIAGKPCGVWDTWGSRRESSKHRLERGKWKSVIELCPPNHEDKFEGWAQSRILYLYQKRLP